MAKSIYGFAIPLFRYLSRRRPHGSKQLTPPKQPDGIAGPDQPTHKLMFGLQALTAEGIEMRLALRSEGLIRVKLEEHLYTLAQLEGMEVRARPG